MINLQTNLLDKTIKFKDLEFISRMYCGEYMDEFAGVTGTVACVYWARREFNQQIMFTILLGDGRLVNVESWAFTMAHAARLTNDLTVLRSLVKKIKGALG